LNFLLHRHFALADLGAAAAGIGAMLPDLWRMADRRVRPSASPAAASGVLGELLAGVDHHVEADRWFHRSAVFVDGERSTAERLRASGIAAPRISLFAHVIWEMCLDGALIEREGVLATTRDLRAAFALTAGAPEDRAADVHHFSRRERGPDERAAFDHRMSRLREEVARGPWIDGYQDGEGLAVRVAGIRSRLGFPIFSADDHHRLADVLDGVARGARPALLALEDERARFSSRPRGAG
jgi:hypothetical protein